MLKNVSQLVNNLNKKYEKNCFKFLVQPITTLFCHNDNICLDIRISFLKSLLQRKEWRAETFIELWLRRAFEAIRTTPTSTLGTHSVIGPVQISIIEQAAKVYCRIKGLHRVKLLKKLVPRGLIADGIQVMPSFNIGPVE